MNQLVLSIILLSCYQFIFVKEAKKITFYNKASKNISIHLASKAYEDNDQIKFDHDRVTKLKPGKNFTLKIRPQDYVWITGKPYGKDDIRQFSIFAQSNIIKDGKAVVTDYSFSDPEHYSKIAPYEGSKRFRTERHLDFEV